MDDEAEIHRKKKVGKTYISSAVTTIDGPLRIASKVIDSDGLYYAKVKKEVVLRRTENARTEIIAKFLESDRELTVVTLQAFGGQTGNPHHTHFSFVGSEITTLLRFFEDIAAVEFNGRQKLNLTDNALRQQVLSREEAVSLVKDNQEVFAEVVQAELTKEDVVTLGYRKKQLTTFQRLMEVGS